MLDRQDLQKLKVFQLIGIAQQLRVPNITKYRQKEQLIDHILNSQKGACPLNVDCTTKETLIRTAKALGAKPANNHMSKSSIEMVISRRIETSPTSLHNLDLELLRYCISRHNIPCSHDDLEDKTKLCHRIQVFYKVPGSENLFHPEVTKEPPTKRVKLSKPLQTYMKKSERYVLNDQRIKSGDYNRDLSEYFKLGGELNHILKQYLVKYEAGCIKLCINVLFKRIDLEGELYDSFYFHSGHNWPIRGLGHIPEYLENQKEFYTKSIDEQEMKGSGWVYVEIKEITIFLTPYKPKNAGSYIKLPPRIEHTHAYINVKNDDELCFRWAILSALFPAKIHPNNPNQYIQYMDQVDWKSIPTPTPLDSKTFEKFEKDNPRLPPLNVHYLNHDNEYYPSPYYTSVKDNCNARNAINLVFYGMEERGHYVYMKNVNSAMAHLYSSGTRTRFPCMKCYSTFPNVEKLDHHSKTCRIDQLPQQLSLPACKIHTGENQKDCHECKMQRYVKFDQHYVQQPIPIKLICDIEAFNIPLNQCQTCQEYLDTEEKRANHQHNTIHLAKQTMAGYGIYIDVLPQYQHLEIFQPYVNQYITYTHGDGEDPPEKHLCQTLLDLIEEIGDLINTTIEPMVMPYDNETDSVPSLKKLSHDTIMKHLNSYREIPNAPHLDINPRCFICGGKFKPHHVKVRDHDHLTGQFRGIAHRGCNLKYSLKNKPIPIIFHNLRGYDSKHLVTAFKYLDPNWHVKPTAQNTENFKFIHIMKRKYKDKVNLTVKGVILDSLAHMDQSIEKLTQNLANYKQSDGQSYGDYIDTIDIRYLRSHFPSCSNAFPNDVDFKLLLRKGVFPYEWFDGPEKLSENPRNVRHQDFASVLSINGNISLDDYKHYRNVVENFDLRNFRQYYDLYLKLDCLLLADICRFYQYTCLDKYGIEPFWHVSAPSLAWNAALKITKVWLELITDIDMYNFFDEGIRGGLSFIACKYAMADNALTRKDNNPQESDTHLDYIDMNNLYGYAMKQALPTGGFQWVSQRQTESNPDYLTRIVELLRQIVEQRPHSGLILDVDLEYPVHLHDLHNQFPLAPEVFTAPGAKSSKLISHLGPRTHYKVDGQTLYFYLQQGMQLTKVHNAMKYQQRAWLEPYIDINTEARQNAKNEFEKNFYKLMNNSFYGQTLMDLTKYTNFAFCTNEKQFMAHMRQPQMVKQQVIFRNCDWCADEFDWSECDCIIGLEKFKINIVLSRPRYIGFKVLELAKLQMYKFWYEVLIPSFGKDSLKLLATDTDSFIIQVRCRDLVQKWIEIQNQTDCMDLSNQSNLNIKENAKVPGKMKRELGSGIMTVFAGIRSKCYSYQWFEPHGQEIQTEKTAKGVPRKNKRDLTFSDYKDLIFKRKPEIRITTTRLQPTKQQMFVKRSYDRVAMAMQDDKRFWPQEPMNTYYGGLEDQYTTFAWNNYRINNDAVFN